MNLPMDKPNDEEDTDILIQLTVHDWNYQMRPRLSGYEPVGDTCIQTTKIVVLDSFIAT